MKRSVVVVVGLLVVVGLVVADVVSLRVVLAPLLGIGIYLFGTASLGSFRRGASYIPDGPPEPVDTTTERVVYWCAGCGAEMLLLVRGTAVAPRHCGEKMTERVEVTSGRGPTATG